MENVSILTDYQLLVVIVNFGVGSKVLKIAKTHGISGGTIILGKGTHKQPLLEFLELAETRKEIVMMIAPTKSINPALEGLEEKLKLHKPNHGIAFVIPVAKFMGMGQYDRTSKLSEGGDTMTSYQAIFTIVDKGRGQEVVDASTQAGAKGATIINARGSGIHETSRLFNMEVEPEKEMVLILAKHEIVQDVIESISDQLEIEKPGNGILFVQEVHQTKGIR
ncbi:MAG: P-II family nitrogen regulator [Acholeplasmataceae bacterium]|jgi:nitrogen regulatory protein PII|nr:P-II family nitrogen regulator [Acholeplasmataceae bacterium]